MFYKAAAKSDRTLEHYTPFSFRYLLRYQTILMGASSTPGPFPPIISISQDSVLPPNPAYFLTSNFDVPTDFSVESYHKHWGTPLSPARFLKHRRLACPPSSCLIIHHEDSVKPPDLFTLRLLTWPKSLPDYGKCVHLQLSRT
jgi:hypothetical protein